MKRPRLAMGFGGLVVAFVAVIVLDANGIENAPLIVCGAALVAMTIVAIVFVEG